VIDLYARLSRYGRDQALNFSDENFLDVLGVLHEMEQPAPALGELAEQILVQIQADADGRKINAGVIEPQRILSDLLRVSLASIGDPVGQKDDAIGRVFPVILASFFVPQHQTRMNIGGAAGRNLLD